MSNFTSFAGKRPGGFDHTGDSPPQTPSKDKNQELVQSCTPVTIKQLLNARQAADSKFIINGVEVSTVIVVGQIMSVSPQVAMTTYLINDGTGSIDARQWNDAENKSEYWLNLRARLVENVYVRVIGLFKNVENQKAIAPYRIVPITDHNEIVYHLLDSLHTSLTISSTPSLGGANNDFSGNQSNLAQDIYNYIKAASNTSTGASFVSIVERLTTEDPVSIRQAIVELENSNKIFGLDDDHYKIIGNL
eukprot:TRINITY_DN3482_c0_g1_i1.p1 TRINITY_DN3482_c0_g1~~TRINITY_DN3482_c0_g1_i1.p1  ORF type:complete len:276 (-),score=73.21 TRINITY_DN3482_c0_g1_i1:13-756(-)